MAEMTVTPVATHGFFMDGRWIEDGDLVEIQGNLNPGEQIVAKGSLFIDRAASGS